MYHSHFKNIFASKCSLFSHSSKVWEFCLLHDDFLMLKSMNSLLF